MSAHIVRRGDTSYSLHALRPGTSAPFGMAEERLFARLIPHLSRAIGLRADIVAASDRIAEHAAALDRCGLAMITLNKRERVITCNDRAEARLKGSGLRLDGKRLHADDHALAVRLGHAVTAALAAESSQDFRAAIPLQNGAFALVRATPRREPNLGRLIPAATILVASTPKPATGAADLRALFDLTPAAAEVALHLAIGSNATEIQQTLGIRYTTLRTHMAQLFAKLDCESQSELVHRLATLLPILQ
jgi:DNA-binding CsgD family transcriptional regulator